MALATYTSLNSLIATQQQTFQYSQNNNTPQITSPGGLGTAASIGGSTQTGVSIGDTRVRLRPQTGQETQVYGPAGPNNILSILYPDATTSNNNSLGNPNPGGNGSGTNGLLFPYTPSITVTQAVDYQDIGTLVHTNGDLLAYRHTPSVTISVTGDFTVQNQREGQYALAVLHFLRTVSKMYFGEDQSTKKPYPNSGLPPPILIFQGYGTYIFNNLPVILKSHSYTFDKSMNMISIQTAQGSATLPAMFTISLDLQVQQTPAAMKNTFNLDQFRTGALLANSTSSTGWI